MPRPRAGVLRNWGGTKPHFFRLIVSFLFSAVFLASQFPSVRAQVATPLPKFTITKIELPFLEANNSILSVKLNNSGQVIGVHNSPSRSSGFYWDKNNGAILLNRDDQGNDIGTAIPQDINDSGIIVGSLNNSHGYYSYPVRWNKASDPPISFDLGSDYIRTASAQAINSAGKTVGNDTIERAYIWNSDGTVDSIVPWNDLSGRILFFGVNDAGIACGVTGAGGPNNPIRPIRYDTNAHTSEDLKVIQPGGVGVSNEAIAINNTNYVVGVVQDITHSANASLWDASGNLQILGPGYAFGINNKNQVVGFEPSSHAFLWTKTHGRLDLNECLVDAGDWTLTEARDINDKGQIVGVGTNQGVQYAYILTPVGSIEPSTSSAPIAHDDTLTVSKNSGAAALPVLDNDEGDELIVISYGGNPKATVTVANGVLTYNPKRRFTGQDTFTYMVQDKSGMTAEATVNVNVTPSNHAPIANAGPDQSVKTTSTTKSVTLDGSQSSDADNDALTYEWREGSTLWSTQQKPTILFSIGDHTITLIVRDSHGAQAQDQVVVKVRKMLLPRSVFVNARDGFGLLDGDVEKPYLSAPNPIVAHISPRVEKTDRLFGTRPLKIWLEITSLEKTGDGTQVIPVPRGYGAVKNILADKRLIAPSTNPMFEATFPTIDSKVTMEVNLTARAMMYTALDELLDEVISVNVDQVLSLYDDVANTTVMQNAIIRFVPMPRTTKDFSRAMGLALKDIAFMDGLDKDIFKAALKKHLKNKKGKNLSDSEVQSILKGWTKAAGTGFKFWQLGELAGDMALVGLATNGNPMILRFEASPLTQKVNR